MTRINTIIPKQLTDQHLIVEYNEIRRPVGLALKRHSKYGLKGFTNIPLKYQLGSGHVLFFYDKLKYLHRRFDEIVLEMKNRGFEVNTDFDTDRIFNAGAEYLYNDWIPTEESKEILKHRLMEKVTTQTTHKYYRQKFDTDWYLKEILNYEK